MSLTRSELQELHDDEFREVTLRPCPVRRRPVALWLGEPAAVPGRWPVALGLAWVAVLAAALVLEPAPSADAEPPLWASLLFLGLFGALGATWAGLARRQRAGLVASAAAAGLALVAAVMCPVSDHHGTVGAWWYLQMAGFTGLVAASLAGLRAARR